MTPEEIANSVPNINPGTYTHDKLVADIRDAIATEREACAMECFQDPIIHPDAAERIAERIRHRGRNCSCVHAPEQHDNSRGGCLVFGCSCDTAPREIP